MLKTERVKPGPFILLCEYVCDTNIDVTHWQRILPHSELCSTLVNFSQRKQSCDVNVLCIRYSQEVSFTVLCLIKSLYHLLPLESEFSFFLCLKDRRKHSKDGLNSKNQDFLKTKVPWQQT